MAERTTNKGKGPADFDLRMEAKLKKITDKFNMQMCSLQQQVRDMQIHSLQQQVREVQEVQSDYSTKLDEVLSTLQQLSNKQAKESVQGGAVSPSTAQERGILSTPQTEPLSLGKPVRQTMYTGSSASGTQAKNETVRSHHFQPKHMIELTMFNGIDARYWIRQFNKYYSTAKREKVQEGVLEEKYDSIYGSKSGLVEARTLCDHLPSLAADPTHIPTPETPCNRCQHHRDNWLCLSCKEVLCSRYVNKHMLQHYQQTNHNVVLSFSDLSVWCFSCNAYLDAQVILQVRPVHELAYILKFGEAPPLRTIQHPLTGVNQAEDPSSGN